MTDNLNPIYRLTLTYLLTPNTWLVFFCATMFCFFSGPFGTLEWMPAGFRLVYWGMIVMLTGIAGLWAVAFLNVRKWHHFHQVLFVAILFGFCVSAIVILFTYALLNPFNAGTLELFLYSFPSAPIVFITIYYLGFRKEVVTESKAEKTVALLSRLKKYPNAKQILSLKAHDHYVEVTTELGSELCLMRLADAISEAEPIIGLQVHRSSWVAKSAIKNINSQGSLAHVLLVNGDALAVSQARLKSLEKYFRA